MTKEEIQRALMEVIQCLASDAAGTDGGKAHVIVARRHIRFLCDLIDKAEADEAASPSKWTITVVLRDGHCVALQNLPGGWMYEVHDEDTEYAKDQ